MPGNNTQPHRSELSHKPHLSTRRDSGKYILYFGPPCAHQNFRDPIIEVKERKDISVKPVSATEAIGGVVAGTRHDLIFSFEKNHFVH